MRTRIGKIAQRIALSVVVLVLVLIGVALAWRAYRQHQSARLLAIDSPSGVDEALFARIGGIDQWITIRGRHRDNPIVLILHGGPGVAMSPFALDSLAWEDAFTVVQWDQRGAGRTFGRSGAVEATVTIDRMVQDGLEVTEFLRRHQHKQKITILGVSWGSIVGIRMAKARPDLFDAYVGTGQVVNLRRSDPLSHAQLLGEARARRDADAIRELEAIGQPPFDALWKLGIRTKWALAYEPGAPSRLGILSTLLVAPRYSLWDCLSWIRGTESSQSHFFGETMSGPVMELDLAAFGTTFEIPLFVFQGANDNITPVQPVVTYVESLNAPQKQLVLIPDAGHMALTTRGDEFFKLLVQWVRPLALATNQRDPL